jgi:two-component system response regulator MprA
MTQKQQILIVEDEHEISRFMELELQCEGYEVTVVHSGMKGLMAAREKPFDLIILDRMLPEMDGIEICRRLRQSSDVPIIMLTAKSEVLERVEGLDAGANDYLVKPFYLEELLARIRTQLRLRQSTLKAQLTFQDLSLDLQTREVKRGTTLVSLSPKEFDLLSLFLQNPRHVLSRDQIITKVWGWDFEGQDNVIEVYMHSLREKIELPGTAKLLHTVRGVGYVLKEAQA